MIQYVSGWTKGALCGFCFLAAGTALGQNYGARANQARNTVYGQSPSTPTRVPYGARTPARTPARTSSLVGLPVGAALTGINVPAYNNYTQPRPVAARASSRGLREAVTAYTLDMGRAPNAGDGGLMALIQRPAGAVNWRGPYITVTSTANPFADPWGNTYRLIDLSRGGRTLFMIKSNGPDGLPDTADDLSITG